MTDRGGVLDDLVVGGALVLYQASACRGRLSRPKPVAIWPSPVALLSAPGGDPGCVALAHMRTPSPGCGAAFRFRRCRISA